MAQEGKDEPLWKATEVAAFLRINPDDVYRLVTQGLLPAVKIGRRTRFRPDDVRAVAGQPTGEAA